MWKCNSCGLLVMFRAVEPEVDEYGFYFLCLGCGHRNELVNVEPGRDGLALAQPTG